MNAKYCANCGSPNYYTLNSPNLCCNCGSKFNTQSFKPQVFANKTAEQLPREAVEEIEESLHSEDFDDIDFVSVDNRHRASRGITLGQLAFDSGAKQKIRETPKLTKKQVADQLNSFLEAAKSDSKRGIINDIPFSEKD